jgi:tRNA dimethylallyltransferase
MAKEKILILVGPTSSGKSALAVALAKKFNGEIISADSRQVYSGLDIGTGKITKREMRGVPHHLLDIAPPKKIFTAQDFIEKGRSAITDIAERGKLPIVTGGTGFYIDALAGRVVLPDVPADPAFRRIHNKKSTALLLCMLTKIDPERAETIDPHNKVRIIRALEIARALGKVPQYTKDALLYDTLWIGIAPKKELHKKIHVRLLSRMRQGMVMEAKRLHAKGLTYKRMRELGLEYGALAAFLQNKISYEDMLERLSSDIRRYAKRQVTYWKRNTDIHWLQSSQTRTIEKETRRFMNKI